MLLVDKFGLAPESADLLVKTVLDGGVSLLLGAGASFGATGGDGEPIKDGASLAREINKVFSVGLIEPDASNLPLVYGDASHPPTKSKLNSFFQARFTNCAPTWQGILFDFKWKRIWTLNIDDVLRRSRHKNIAYNIDSYNWIDRFRPRSLATYALQIIHLHGRADKLTEHPDHLIFSLKEYVSRQEAAPGWHTEFRSEYAQKPFIVCGARLQDEVDLISVIEYGNRSFERGGCPSFIVCRDFVPGQETRLKRQGLIPVAAKGEDFFRALLSDVLEFQAANPPINEAFENARSEIKEKFRMLQLAPVPIRRPLDFYSSAETQWSHILDDLDAPFDFVARLISDLKSNSSKVVVSLISGGPVSGKSACVLRIAKNLIQTGYEVWQFRGEETFSDVRLLPYLENSKNVVLLFDDCADYSMSVERLVNLAAKNGTEVKIVATCDQHRLRAVQSDIPQLFRRDYSVDPVRHGDFDSVFAKRLEKGRMGRLTSVSIEDAWREFRQSFNNRLLEWLESLENAHPYRDAIVRMFSTGDHTDADAKSLISAVATVQRFGYSLPGFLADDFRGRDSLETLIAEGGKLEQLAYLNDQGLRLRSSAFAQFVWRHMSTPDKKKWTSTIVRKLAPLVTPQAIARRSIAYLIVRQVMSWENIYRDFGVGSEEWYFDIENVFGWNARFWEQRALLASEYKNESAAYSYAKKAIQLHEHDPFTWTTLGKVCVKIGVDRDDQVGADRFFEGVSALERSRDLSINSGTVWEHPYVTFFSYTLRAIKLDQFKNEKARLNQAWIQWMRLANEAGVFNHGNNGRSSDLDEFHRLWLLSSVQK